MAPATAHSRRLAVLAVAAALAVAACGVDLERAGGADRPAGQAVPPRSTAPIPLPGGADQPGGATTEPGGAPSDPGDLGDLGDLPKELEDLLGQLEGMLGGGGGPGRTGVRSGTLDWKACDEGFECATLDVPVDHDQPAGKTLELGLVRVPAADPEHRIGSLVANPGGPGGSAVDFVEQAWRNFPEAVTNRFDLVGFDPRGVGRSTPLDCHANVAEMYGSDQSPDTPAERDRLLAVSRAYVDGCAEKYGDLLPHLGTEAVARDMEAVRVAVGDDKLTYVGFSYGTSIGQEYAALFPGKVRAMVLDGVVDVGIDGLDFAVQQANGFQRSLEGFAAWCKAQADCGLGADPLATLAAVKEEVERDPIPGGSRPAGPAELNQAVTITQYSTDTWPVLAQAVTAAKAGDGSVLVMLADAALGKDPLTGGEGNGFEIYFAVSCLDNDWPDDPAAVLAAGERAVEDSPIVGEEIVDDYVRCALWPTEPKPLAPVTAKGAPPIVVVSSTGDPATPHEWGENVAERLDKGVLVTFDGFGHTAFAHGNSCIDGAVAPYLVEGTVPSDGLRCT